VVLLRHALRRLATKRLTETPHAHYREVQVPESEPSEQFYYRATSAGLYHIRFWTGAFAFLDAMSTDTPIFDQDAREEVSRLAASFDIGDRFGKTVCFRNYLETQWQRANIGADFYDFSALLALQDGDFDAVRQVIDRAATKQRQRARFARSS
jgi:hypothetical protein